jgi:CubicO group peptidase (beta-lactamase class C family)
VRFALASPKRDWQWEWSAARSGEQFFIASATKLYVTAIVMQLRDEGALDLDAPAAEYIGSGVMAGDNVFDGVDYGPQITVRELLSHTSGIADYFEDKQDSGGTVYEQVLGEDRFVTFDEVLRITKEEMKPHFAPSPPGKAFYSDTNFQLLGEVIEAVTGDSFDSATDARIIRPLGLLGTYLFTPDTLNRYHEVADILHGKEPITIPKFMASVGPDGGIVSTTRDGIVFLQAFMSGGLFPAEYLDEMQQQFNRIFTPLEYGLGMMRFAPPRYYSLLRPVPPMVGHSGATGVVMYRVPQLDLYISGTVNQVKKRALPYRLMLRLIMECQSAWRV